MFFTSKHISLNPISINIEAIMVRGDQMAQLSSIQTLSALCALFAATSVFINFCI